MKDDVLRLADGRIVVPDNRWDLVDEPGLTPTVSVVIPYYNQAVQLALVLDALAAQSYPTELIDVVIADDGSSEAPAIERWTSTLAIRVVWQEDKGFRAAAARNLGAAASVGSILCFLDADTVPAPDYIRRAVTLPSAVPDAIVVGRRKHADLSGVTADELAEWVSGQEPQWLRGGYRRSANLLEPGWDGYKYVLSAVLTCSRELFEETGGFDTSFVRYGGEDWEFANRAFMMGAVLAHEPEAVAWHDGPDWAERDVSGRTEEKNAEALALAPLVTDPAARSLGLRYEVPDHVVLVSTEGHSAASLTQTIASAVRGVDSAVWLVGADARRLYDELRVADSRVRPGYPDESVLSRCRYVVELNGRVLLSDDTLTLLARDVEPGSAGEVVSRVSDMEWVRMRSSRARHRARRWSSRTGKSEAELIEWLFGVLHRAPAEVGLTVATEEPWLSW